MVEGFRNSDTGDVPNDWVSYSVEELTPKNKQYNIVDGPFGSNLKTIHYRKSGIPIITSGYVTDGRFVAKEYLYVDLEKFKQEKRSAVRGGDIVMAKIGERCGASAILPENHQVGILSGNALKITIDENRFSKELISQILWRHHVKGDFEILRTTGAQPAISMANLKKYKISLPPTKTEQTAIATALNDIDILINDLERFLSKKQSIKTGVMQQLLKPKEGWEVKRLKQIAVVSRENVIPYLSPKTIFAHFSLPAFDNNKKASFELGENIHSNKFKVPPNSILISKLNPRIPRIWMPKEIPQNAIASTEFIILNCKEMVSKEYLFTYCSSRKFSKQLEQAVTGTTGSHQRIKPEDAVRIEIAFPKEIEEQNSIAQIIGDMDNEIQELEKKIAKCKMLKQGMMQDLLTGRIRLVYNARK